MVSNMFEDYYTNQVMRGGSDVFKGCYYQRGYGLRRTQRGYGVGRVMKGWAHMATPNSKRCHEKYRQRTFKFRNWIGE